MTEGLRDLRDEPFLITMTQLKELIELINLASLDSRIEISQSKNGNAFECEKVHRENWILVVENVSEPNGSIYIENIYVSLDCVKIEISSCLTILRSIRNNHHKFRSGKAPHDALFPAVGDFDNFVKSQLAECYKQVTGERPTMGGYKRTKGLGDQTRKARPTNSPFTQFALFMIELIGIRRLNGQKFTVNVLRNARSANVGKAGACDSEVRPETPNLKAKPKGRPASDRDPRKLRIDRPIEVESCSADELKIIMSSDR